MEKNISILTLFFFLSLPPLFSQAALSSDTDSGENITLESCFNKALQRSEELAIKKVDIEKSWGEFLQASAEVIGDGNFVMTHFRQEMLDTSSGEGGSTSTSLRTSRRERRFEFSQPLFQGFRSMAGLWSVRNTRRQREEDLRRAEHVLFSEVTAAFHQILRQRKDLEITEEILTLFRSRIKQLEKRHDIGKSRPSEIATAEARMKIIEADLAGIRGEMAFQTRLLEFLTGEPVDPGRIREPQADEQGPYALERYLEGGEIRPDVLASEYAVKNAFQGVLIAQSGFWPAISLDNRAYVKREGFQSDISWDVLFTVDVPIFSGGDTLGKVLTARKDLQRERLVYSRVKRLADLEIKQAYDAWLSALTRLNAFTAAVKASERNYRLQKEDYERNLVDNLDVLEALEALHDTRREVNLAEAEERTRYWLLKVASGDCCESI